MSCDRGRVVLMLLILSLVILHVQLVCHILYGRGVYYINTEYMYVCGRVTIRGMYYVRVCHYGKGHVMLHEGVV